MVPSDALPPGVLFTSHVTAELVLPLTVAVNCCVPPTGVSDVAGDIVTEMADGDDGEDTGEFEPDAGLALDPPPQPEPRLQSNTAENSNQLEEERKRFTLTGGGLAYYSALEQSWANAALHLTAAFSS